MKVGDKGSLNGQPFTVVWSSDNMTDEERYESHMCTADFMEQYGLSGALQRELAKQYRRDSDTRPKDGDAQQGSTRE